MIVVTADDALQAYLATLKERTEIRDSQGRLLGVFTPSGEERIEEATRVRKLFDPEELRARRLREGNHPGYTIDQVMEHLRARENPQ